MHIEAAPADVAKIAALGGAAVDNISPEVTPYIHGNMNQ